MARFTKEDLDRLLDQTFYAWDTSAMMSDVIAFLEFSESNLSWQRRRELAKARHEAATTKFSAEDEHLESQFRHQLIEGVEYWFDVSLSQRIRYAGLVAFFTTIEWSAKVFARQMAPKRLKRVDGENRYVQLFAVLNERSRAGYESRIEELRKLVHVRDCIVHSAGFLEGRAHDKDVRKAIAGLKGFKVWEENLLGTSVHIEQGAIEKYARSANDWIPKLVERCVQAKVLA